MIPRIDAGDRVPHVSTHPVSIQYLVDRFFAMMMYDGTDQSMSPNRKIQSFGDC